jgi:hypothetical protein
MHCACASARSLSVAQPVQPVHSVHVKGVHNDSAGTCGDTRKIHAVKQLKNRIQLSVSEVRACVGAVSPSRSIPPDTLFHAAGVGYPSVIVTRYTYAHDQCSTTTHVYTSQQCISITERYLPTHTVHMSVSVAVALLRCSATTPCMPVRYMYA